MPIIKKVIDKLIKKNISISVAESCTGGLIASTITKYSGVSKIFSYGIISYSNNLSKVAHSEEIKTLINLLQSNRKT